jgi:hypothetical protein
LGTKIIFGSDIMYVNLNENTSDVSWRLRLSAFGKLSLDEILEDVIVYNDYDIEEIERQRKIFDIVEYVVDHYLTNKERLIYYCIIHLNKKISEVMSIVGFDEWRTTSNNVERVFKIIRLYYDYECLDFKELNKILNKNFTPFEKYVIQLLEQRYTIHEVKDELHYHYAKAYMLIKDILDRLSKLPEPCHSYYEFLVNIRKFKKLSDFNIKNNRCII